MRIKWETMKRRAAVEVQRTGGWFLADPSHNFWIGALICTVENHKPWRENLEELQKRALQRVNDWDVRCCMKLVAVIPAILPKRFHDKVPVAFIDDGSGEWVLEFN